MGDSLQVTFFLDPNDTLVRFDFAASDTSRTFATTRFFNIVPGPVNATVFETSCQ
jgi:MoxR-like ATPase